MFLTREKSYINSACVCVFKLGGWVRRKAKRWDWILAYIHCIHLLLNWLTPTACPSYPYIVAVSTIRYPFCKAQATALSAGPLCPASDRNTPNPNKGISTPLLSLMVLEKLVATVTMLLFTSVSTLLKTKIQNIKNVSKMVICLSKEILSWNVKMKWCQETEVDEKLHPLYVISACTDLSTKISKQHLQYSYWGVADKKDHDSFVLKI